MSKYVFPAVFEKEDVGFSIYFPDLETCFTQGNDLEDGLNMANDVLCMTLYDMEVEGAEIPKPTDPMTI
ncbi:MAG: type II toxin-antitoxin system HicB family antitoxin, partial [Oscillospiraceae bacterium]